MIRANKIKVGDFVRTKKFYENIGGRIIPEGSTCKVYQKSSGIGIKYKGIHIRRVPEYELEKVTMIEEAGK